MNLNLNLNFSMLKTRIPQRKQLKISFRYF